MANSAAFMNFPTASASPRDCTNSSGNSDLIQMAHYAQTVNVIGAIKTTKTAAEMETTGLVLQLYRAHYGKIPLEIRTRCLPTISPPRSARTVRN